MQALAQTSIPPSLSFYAFLGEAGFRAGLLFPLQCPPSIGTGHPSLFAWDWMLCSSPALPVHVKGAA